MQDILINKLIEVIGTENVLTGSDVAERYYHIWKMEEDLQAKAYLLPKTTEDISAIMRTCHLYNQSVIVYGGLTNLVGATETRGDEVIISMERMNQILETDTISRTMTVEAGVILENIQKAAQEEGLLFPLNFGAKGTAQIGGIIATNAGGLRVLRYGMTRQNILGLEAVLADGTVISSLKKIIKDNSAYDLKQLFVGSEGTLGVITKAVLKLSEAPKSRNSAFIGVNDFDHVVKLLKHMDGGLAGMLSGFELIWNPTYRALTGEFASVKAPLPYDYKYYVLVENMGSDQEADRERLEGLVAEALEKGFALDAVIAYTESDLQWFWTVREDVHAMVATCPVDQHFDISLPIPEIGRVIDNIVAEVEQVEGCLKCYPFGHIADGNIHLVMSKANDDQALTDKINDIVYAPLKALGGSVSAEHGIGSHKKRYLHLCRTDEEITLMRTLKSALDPKGLLNPGKVL